VADVYGVSTIEIPPFPIVIATSNDGGLHNILVGSPHFLLLLKIGI
jgi:hypothetical protein